MIDSIKTINDVIIFAEQITEEGTNIHPDDNFLNIINLESNEPAYTTIEATKRNNLMSECFLLCEKEGIDIYDTILEVFLKKTGLDQSIPLPSSEY